MSRWTPPTAVGNRQVSSTMQCHTPFFFGMAMFKLEFTSTTFVNKTQGRQERPPAKARTLGPPEPLKGSEIRPDLTNQSACQTPPCGSFANLVCSARQKRNRVLVVQLPIKEQKKPEPKNNTKNMPIKKRLKIVGGQLMALAWSSTRGFTENSTKAAP